MRAWERHFGDVRRTVAVPQRRRGGGRWAGARRSTSAGEATTSVGGRPSLT